MKKVGEFNGIPVYVDPNCPPDTMYLINDDTHKITNLKISRWQKFGLFVRRIKRAIGEAIYKADGIVIVGVFNKTPWKDL